MPARFQEPANSALPRDEQRSLVPRGTKLSRFMLAEPPSIPTIVGAWVSSVGELTCTKNGGPLIQCDRDFSLCHTSTTFSPFFVAFLKRCEYQQTTRSRVFVCANWSCTIADASMDKMSAHAPDNVVFLANSSLSLREGCGLAVILEPGTDVGHNTEQHHRHPEIHPQH